MRKRLAMALALVAVTLTLVAWPAAERWVRAGELLTQLSSKEPPAHSAVLVETDIWLPANPSPIRARLYRLSEGGQGRGVVVAHGVHYQGIDERRLVPFARGLARSGLVVLTPELGDLMDYQITARGVDVIRASVRYLDGRQDLAIEDKVGLLGFSFAGGLSLVAAEDPATADQIAFVTSVGGHHDLTRVLEFLVSGHVATPEGIQQREPHEYGLVILAYQYIDRFVPEPDQDIMREALKAWLQEDRPRARALASQRTTAEADRLFSLIESKQLGQLAGEFRAIIDDHRAELDALSPRGRLARIHAPVYLLHGQGDSVIPPSETEWAARELKSAHSPHLALVTPLIEHVAVDHVDNFGDKVALVRFMAHLM